MKKSNIIQKSDEFSKIIKETASYKSKAFIVHKKENNLDIPRFGITVPTKIGNAVTRNKIKRQIKNIIDNNKKMYKIGVDYIIIVRRELLDFNFIEINRDLNYIFKKAHNE